MTTIDSVEARILGAVAFAAEALLRARRWEEGVAGVLARLGEAAEASRAYVFSVSRDGEGSAIAAQRYEWVAAGVDPQIDNPDLAAIDLAAAGYGRWESVLAAGGVIAGTVASFPETERALLEAQSIRSLIVAPIFAGDEWWGFIGFDDCGTGRGWSDTERNALTTAGRIIGAAIDRQRSAEQTLLASEARTRAVFEGAAIGIALVDPAGRTVATNPALQDLLGYTPEELLRLSPGDVTHPEDVTKDWELFQDLVAGRRPRYSIEKRYLHKSGSVVWTRLTVSLVRQPAGDYAVAIVEDVTERRKAEEILRESEERFRLLAGRIRQVFYVSDPQPFRILYVSPAYETIWQRPAAEIYRHAHSFLEPIPDEDRPVVFEALQRQLAGEETEAQYRVVRADGTIRWIRDRAYPVVRDGRVFRIVGLAEDVTDAREAAEEIRKAHERYELAARATNDVIWDWDLVESSSTWSDALRNSFGYDPRQIADPVEWWHGHIHPDDRERVLGGFYGAVDSGTAYWSDEYRFQRADGRYAEVLDRGYIARDADGRAVRMIGAMTDLTERNYAQRISSFMAEASALLASSLDYHSTLKKAAELSVPVLADWCVIDIRTGDGTYERLAIAHSDPAQVQMAWDLFRENPPDPSQPYDPVREAIARGTSVLFDEITPEQLDRMSRSNRHQQALRSLGVSSVIVVPLVIPGEVPFGALTLVSSESRRLFGKRDLQTAEDLARRAALAIEHARLYREAQQANRAKDEFLATLSHELRTPLTAILGWSGIISESSPDAATIRLGMETIHRSAIAQAKLIDDVLDVSRISSGKMRLDIQPVSLDDVIRESVDAVRPAAAAKKIEVAVPAGTFGTAMVDPNRLQQVVWNLLSNAIKFTSPGGRVTLDVDATPAMIRLTVTDSGQGIAADFLPHVFEPFRQGDATLTRTHSGLGLGLAIVRYIVEAHGGTTSAASDGPGRGARFVVELPRIPASAAGDRPGGLDAEAEPAAHSAERLDGLRVLFVDDQNDARLLARVILERAGAEVHTAESAREALRILDQHPVDVVVADIAMPEMDGYDLLREMRRRDEVRNRRTTAIAATAYGTPADRDHVIAAGFDGYLKKPMHPADLTRAIRLAVE